MLSSTDTEDDKAAFGGGVAAATGSEDGGEFTLNQLADRAEAFEEALIGLVAQHHQVFLDTLPGRPVVPRASLRRWHSDFAIEGVSFMSNRMLSSPLN